MARRKTKVTDTSNVELPLDFIQGLSTQYGGTESALIVKALNSSPSVSIRFNRRKTDADFIKAHFKDYNPVPVEWCRSGFHLAARPDFIHDPLLHAGIYYVQEAASMIYEEIMAGLVASIGTGSGNSLRILDMCASPGGKTTAILNAVRDKYVVVANEYDRKRSKILKENLDKWGDPNVIVTNSPSARFKELSDYFDIVAVDAPCSGEGMMRREPIARSQWSPDLVKQCGSLQREILGDAVSALRPGGFLIYSTCTFNTIENESNVDWLLKTYGLEMHLPPRRFMPHQHCCEGLFAAVLKKPEGNAGVLLRSEKTTKNKRIVKDDIIYISDNDILEERIGDRIFAIPTEVNYIYQILNKRNFNILSAGVEIAKMKNNSVIPSSRQVVSINFKPDLLPVVDLDYDQSLLFLKGNPVILQANISPGYVAVSYLGHPVGLMKNIGPRANNLYPPEWKIK